MAETPTDPAAPGADSPALSEDSAWILDLARRLVVDASHADDLAQEAWIQATVRPPSNPERLRTWIYSVLRNLANRSRRTDARRRRRERYAARTERVDHSAGDILQRAELERSVRHAVLELPEPYRSTVLLRYFEGRSSAEIAQEQGVARATVRSRIGRALRELRSRLDHKRSDWLALAIPILETPTRLKTAPTSAGTGSAAIVSTGVSIVAHNFWIGSTCLVIGGLVGWTVKPEPAPRHRVPPPDARSEDGVRLSELEESLKRVRDEQGALLESERRLDAENASLRRQVAALEEEQLAERETLEIDSDPAALPRIDWRGLARMVAANAHLLQKDRSDLTPADDAKLSALYGKIAALSAAAKSLHDNPLWSPGFLTDLAAAVHGGALGLDDEQAAALRELTQSIELELPGVDEQLPSLERFQIRSAVSEGLHAGIQDLLTEDQLEAWPKIQEFSRRLLAHGSRMDVGTETRPDGLLDNWLSNAVRPGEVELDKERLRPLAERFRSEAMALLERHGLAEIENFKSATPEQIAAYENELIDIQLRFENNFSAQLPAELQRRFQSRHPVIVRFRPGRSMSVVARQPYF